MGRASVTTRRPAPTPTPRATAPSRQASRRPRSTLAAAARGLRWPRRCAVGSTRRRVRPAARAAQPPTIAACCRTTPAGSQATATTSCAHLPRVQRTDVMGYRAEPIAITPAPRDALPLGYNTGQRRWSLDSSPPRLPAQLGFAKRPGGAKRTGSKGQGPHHGGEWPEHRRRRDGVAASRQQVEAEGDHVEERDRGGDAEQPAAQRRGQGGS